MCMMITAFANRVILNPRETLHFCRNATRLYHRHGKLCLANSCLLGKRLLPSFAIDTWTVQRTSHEQQKKTIQGFSGILTKQQAKELASKLTSVERELFLKALQECKSEEDKAEFQNQLAVFKWCSKFGRPSKVSSLGDVDPTGTYCSVPEDWLQRKYAESIPEPSMKDLIKALFLKIHIKMQKSLNYAVLIMLGNILAVAMENAIPFIFFGFLDNFIMIVAGDQIEMILSIKFPISTMLAAALGNTVSDIIGIAAVSYVERFVRKFGFKPPNLSPAQLNLHKTKQAANLGRVVGVTIGCIIGMTPIPVISYFHNGD